MRWSELQRLPFEIGERDRIRADLDDAVVVDHDHLPGVLEKCRDVGSEEVLTLATTDHQRRAAPRPDQDIGLGASHHHQGERPVGLVHHLAHRFGEAEVGHLLDHVGDHLGVGVALEDVTVVDELLLEVDPVLDDPVVHHDHVPGAVEMGMGIAGVGGTVGGPPGVPDPGMGHGRRFAVDELLEIGDPSRLFEDGQRVAMVEGHAR